MFKRLAAFLVLAWLALPSSHAQCTGAFTQTVMTNTPSLTLGAADRVRIAPGAHFTGAVNSLAAGSELCVDAGATVDSVGVYGSNGLIRNFGASTVFGGINFNAGSSIVNTGTMTFNGYFSVSGAVSISNERSARLVINPYIGLTAGSTLTNAGSLTFGGQFALMAGATFTNDNRTEVATNWQPAGTVYNNGFINGQGQINIDTGAVVHNTCWLYTQGNFYNSGSFVNSGAVRAFGTGAWQNNGAFQGTTTSFVVGVNFQNGGSGVTGYGTYRFTGTTNNYAAFTGSSASSPILFYDTTRTGTQIMDAEYPPPTNTIRPATDPGAVDPDSFTPAPCAEPYADSVKRVNLTIAKTNGVSSVPAGGTTSYLITVTNGGPSAADGAVLADPAVAGLACTSASCSVTGGGASCPGTVTPGALAGGLALASFPAGSSLTFSLVCDVTASGLP
ncbi:MAG: DUF11 domain-containing protein [Ramlibacter sp.]|nr:DUF11 domain-containing protein [Ramlibacter sp.]